MIRVGVDAWNLTGDRRGIGRYLRCVLREWRERFADRVEVTLIVPEWHTWTVASRYRDEVAGHRYRVASRRWHGRAGLDVLWFPFNGCSWLNFSLPAVATLHDATNFVIPGYQPEAQVIFQNAAARCRLLITDSVFSQHELARELQLPAERFIPIPLGVSPPEDSGPGSMDVQSLVPFVFFVGTSDHRKGLDVLCEAMVRVQAKRPDVRLVLAGETSDRIPNLHTVRNDMLGYVDDTTLAALYRAASVFAFPSRYEGFGLPPLEAMKYGTPVVTTDNSAIPEAAGNAALYVPIDDSAALGDAILRVLNDAALGSELRSRGLARASEMSWTKTAEATLAVLEGAAVLNDGSPSA